MAAADAGGYGGVELWIKSALQIDPESIFVLRPSPKLLVPTLVWQTQLTCFAVMRGPDAAYGAEAVPLWWVSTAATLRQLRPAGCRLFILADTTAKVGSIQTPFVGGHQADQETTAGELLHELMAEQDLAIPATFASTGEGWMWQSNSGRRHRIDYVICPVAWLPAVARAEVPEDVSLALEDRLDHRLAMSPWSRGRLHTGPVHTSRLHAAHQSAGPPATGGRSPAP